MTLNVESTITHVGAHPPAAGHNTPTGNPSVPKEALTPASAEKVKTAAAQLRSVVERIEAIEAEKLELSSDVKDIYAEAKGNGYDLKALRTVVRMRKIDVQKRQEAEAVLETYMLALGML